MKMPVKTQPPSKQFAESLSGLIERVTFFNEQRTEATGRSAGIEVRRKGGFLSAASDTGLAGFRRAQTFGSLNGTRAYSCVNSCSDMQVDLITGYHCLSARGPT